MVRVCSVQCLFGLSSNRAYKPWENKTFTLKYHIDAAVLCNVRVEHLPLPKPPILVIDVVLQTYTCSAYCTGLKVNYRPQLQERLRREFFFTIFLTAT